MFTVAYVLVILCAAAVFGFAALANLTGQADKMRVPRSWMLPLGTLLGAGALGLLAGFVVPVLGTLAAAGLVLYFVGAFGAHLWVRVYNLGPWSVFFALAVATLVVSLAYHGPS